MLASSSNLLLLEWQMSTHELKVRQLKRMDFIQFTGPQRDAMDRNFKRRNPQGYSAWQEHHVFSLFVFYQTAGVRSGEYMCEWGRRRQRESRLDGSKLNSCQHLSSVNVLSRVCQSAFSCIGVPALHFQLCESKPCKEKTAEK